MTIHYQIHLERSSHQYNITLSFVAKSVTQELKLATWIPGSYMVREFSKNIVNIKAKNNIHIITQINKNTWHIDGLNVGEKVEVEYNVYALDFGIRTAYLDNSRAYFNNTSLCIYLPDSALDKHIIEIIGISKPDIIATGLPEIDTNIYCAENYQHLIDCPFEIGDLTILEFMVKNIPHRIVLSGSVISNLDKNRLISDVSNICATQINMFGGVALFINYSFLLYMGGSVYTGLEHCNSTALMAPYYSLPSLAHVKRSDEYTKLLGLISHEYFHLWNVKRIKPTVFNPYNMDQENYTKLLWWFEGITSYYDDLVTYRAGIIDKKQYLQLITDNINNVYKFNGVNTQSLANSSLTSWIKYYRQDENSANAIVSYYIKGAIVGMCLDLLIRKRSNNLKSLDDVMLGLYNQWQDDGRGIAENEIPSIIAKYTGVSLDNEIIQMVETSELIDIESILADFGISVYTVKNQQFIEKGKVIDLLVDTNTNKKIDIGWKLNKEALGYKILNIYSDTIAMNAGFATGDILIAINGMRLHDIDKQLSLYTLGDTVEFTFFRNDSLQMCSLSLEYSICNTYYLQIQDNNKMELWL